MTGTVTGTAPQDEFEEYKECVVAVMQGATSVDLSAVDCNPETVAGTPSPKR